MGRHVEVTADDLAGRRAGFGPQRFDRLHDLPIAPLPLARRIRRIPFQVRVQDCQAFALAIEKQQLGDMPRVGAAVAVGKSDSLRVRQREAAAAKESRAAIGSIGAFQCMRPAVP